MRGKLPEIVAASILLALVQGSCQLLFPTRDDTPPVVSITAPVDGASLSGTVAIAATASDDKGVFKVVFYVDGASLSEDLASPYTASWDTTAMGTGAHTIRASAFDSSGNEGRSTTLAVTTSGGAGAGVAFQRDFENFPSGMTWSAIIQKDPSLLFGVLPTTSAASSLKIELDPTAGSHGKVVHAVDSAIAGETVLTKMNFGEVAKGELFLDVDVSAESVLTLTFGHLSGESSLKTGGFLMIAKKAGSDAWLYSVSPAEAMVEAASLGLKTWRRIRLPFDSTSGKYSVFVDGEKALDSQSFVQAVASVNFISVSGMPDDSATKTYAADFYLDNVRVLGTTTELFVGGPGSIAAPSPLASQGTTTVPGVLVFWAPVSGAASYKVYRSISSTGPYAEISSFAANTADTDHYVTTNGGRFLHDDLKAVPGVHYFYRVSSLDSAAVEGPLSDALEGWANKPATPTGVAATWGSYADKVVISWTAGASSVTGYHLYRSSSAEGTYTSVGYLNSAGTSGNDTTVTLDTHFFYRVAAFDGGSNEGDPSSPAAEGWATAIPLVSTLAGGGSLGGTTSGHGNGTGSVATFNSPYGLCVDSAGNVYVGDLLNNLVRKVSAAGVVTTLAGGGSLLGTSQGYLDARGVSAKFYWPNGVVMDASGNLYVADGGNNLIRKISPAGTVSTFAGGGSALGTASGYLDGTGTAAKFNNPCELDIDASGNLYVTDCDNNLIRKISPAGVVTTLAGGGSATGTSAGFVDGEGRATKFKAPGDAVVDSAGNVYVADSGNNVIRRISPTGTVTTLAGGGSAGSKAG